MRAHGQPKQFQRLPGIIPTNFPAPPVLPKSRHNWRPETALHINRMGFQMPFYRDSSGFLLPSGTEFLHSSLENSYVREDGNIHCRKKGSTANNGFFITCDDLCKSVIDCGVDPRDIDGSDGRTTETGIRIRLPGTDFEILLADYIRLWKKDQGFRNQIEASNSPNLIQAVELGLVAAKEEDLLRPTGGGGGAARCGNPMLRCACD